MTIRRFYELSLFVPVVVPLLMALATDFGTALLAVPYLGLVYLARWRMRRMSEPEMVKLSLRAPFLFAGLACLCFLTGLGGSAFTGSSSVLVVDGGKLLGGGVALLAAAEYVLLVDGVLFVCYLAKLVRREMPVVFL